MHTSAKVIADSISESGIRITTFELEFPRIILAEFNTHRLFSRNAASTRAIPLKKQLEYLVNRNFEPCPFTQNKPGMASNQPAERAEEASVLWKECMERTIQTVGEMEKLGISKQHAGRLLEPFTHIKVVCTATEYDNFFYLRRHPDAQPEIQELAEMMHQARANSNPVPLTAYEWHVPYYEDGFWIEAEDGKDVYGNALEDALMISSSCCAQVSYRKLDDSLEKAKDIFQRLVEAKPVHASPFEHQATPFTLGTPANLENGGLTHIDSKGAYWSGNFRGWIQHRQLLKDHTCWSYEG